MIDMNKKYTTRDGRQVRILCTDRDHPFPVVGLVYYNGSEDTYAWNNGQTSFTVDSKFDKTRVEQCRRPTPEQLVTIKNLDKKQLPL